MPLSVSRQIEKWQANFGQLLSSEKTQKAGLGILLGFLVWQLGAFFSLFLQQPQPPLLPKIQPIAPQQSSNQVVGQPLMLLGQPRPLKKVESAPQPLPQVQKTRLNLKLVGLIDLGEKGGVALIQKGLQTLIVAPGEWIQPGVKLLQLFPNQVLIEHKGRQERLILLGAEQQLQSPKTQQQETPAKLSQSIDRQKLKRIVSRLRRQPMAISQYLRFQPLRRNGQWVGVQIWPKTEPEIFKALGFRSGDIIRQVDGYSIQQMSEQPQLWQKFTQQSQFELQLDRQGDLQVLSIDLNALSAQP